MRRLFLIAAGLLVALATGQIPSASAQGFSVQVGPGGVAVGDPYREGRRRDYYDRREYRGRGAYRGRGERGSSCRTIIERDGPYTRKTRICR